MTYKDRSEYVAGMFEGAHMLSTSDFREARKWAGRNAQHLSIAYGNSETNSEEEEAVCVELMTAYKASLGEVWPTPETIISDKFDLVDNGEQVGLMLVTPDGTEVVHPLSAEELLGVIEKLPKLQRKLYRSSMDPEDPLPFEEYDPQIFKEIPKEPFIPYSCFSDEMMEALKHKSNSGPSQIHQAFYDSKDGSVGEERALLDILKAYRERKEEE